MTNLLGKVFYENTYFKSFFFLHTLIQGLFAYVIIKEYWFAND